MNPDLKDNSWMHGGTSLLWDADALTRICPAQSVRSLREFLRLYEDGWPEAALKLINGRTLVVAGLEAAMDTLPPERAVEWLEKTVYEAIYDFQQEIADGGSQAALILWLTDSKRIVFQLSDSSHHWRCSGTNRQESLPLGRCIWNGAEQGVRRIMVRGVDSEDTWAGLFLQRIS